MAITINKAFVREYRDMVIHLAQQEETRLRAHVTEVSSKGESYSFDRLAATDAVEKTGRRQTNVYVDDTWSRRLCTPKTFNHTMTIEHEDRVQMLIEPKNAYATNQGMAMRRKYDALIIEAATGNALDGDSTPVTFPATQRVGDGTAQISFDLVSQVQGKFLAKEITPDVPKVMVVGPNQVVKLMQLTQQTSADYVRREALQKLQDYGIVPNWMGFTWILSNQLLAPSAGQLSCLAFTRAGIGLVVNQDIFVRITENPERQYMIQVFSQFTANATRVEDEHVVELRVADAV